MADVDHVELGAIGREVIVAVHVRDAGEWARADASEIADLWLWLEVLAESDVTILSPLPLYLPPALSVLVDRIAEATRARQTDRLPRAMVVRSR